MASPQLVELRDLAKAEKMVSPERTGMAALAHQIIEKLKTKEIGEGVEYRIPAEVSGSKLRAQLSHLSYIAGLGITTRFSGDLLRVWRKEPRKVLPVGRDLEIVMRRMDGERLEVIASDFRMTRERVRQIVSSYPTFRELPISERKSALDEFVAPFLEAVPESPLCLLCGDVISVGNRSSGACQSCRKSLKQLSMASARLRAFKKLGNRHYLSEAVKIIKRHNIQPQDLRRG